MGYNVDDYIGGQYLNADLVKEQNLVNKNLQIANVVEEEFTREGQVQKKLALELVQSDRLLVLNSTNATIMKQAFGKDTDEWINKTIQLTITKRKFKGDLVDGIQINTDLPTVGGSSPKYSEGSLDG